MLQADDRPFGLVVDAIHDTEEIVVKPLQKQLKGISAFAVATMMVETLKKCGDNLTRANVMKQAANFQKVRIPLLLPGINISTSATDFYPIQAVQMQRFKGETWELFGDVMHAESS